MDHNGKKYGFPGIGMCSVQRDLKVKPMDTYIKSINEPVFRYVGICMNEKKRLDSLHKKEGFESLLEKYEFTDDMARNKCLEYGLLSPGYEYSKRGGCWFCPNAKRAEQQAVRTKYPEIWKQFVSLENDPDIVYNRFNPFGFSLHEIDTSLKWDEAQITLWDLGLQENIQFDRRTK